MLFNTAAAQSKIDFQNKFNKVFPELYSTIETENISVSRMCDGCIAIYDVQEIIGYINTEWVKMGKLRIDAPNMTDSQRNKLFRLLREHGLAH